MLYYGSITRCPVRGMRKILCLLVTIVARTAATRAMSGLGRRSWSLRMSSCRRLSYAVIGVQLHKICPSKADGSQSTQLSRQPLPRQQPENGPAEGLQGVGR